MATSKHKSILIGITSTALWATGLWFTPMQAKSAYIIATLFVVAVWQAIDGRPKSSPHQ